jgi:hypothetical protein
MCREDGKGCDGSWRNPISGSGNSGSGWNDQPNQQIKENEDDDDFEEDWLTQKHKQGDRSKSIDNRNTECHGRLDAILHPDGSCGTVTLNPDPLMIVHMTELILMAVVSAIIMEVIGVVMIVLGAGLCTSVIGCIAGVMLIVPGAAALGVGVGFAYAAGKFTEKFIDELLPYTPPPGY